MGQHTENTAHILHPSTPAFDRLADVAAALSGLSRAITSLRRLTYDVSKLRVLLVQRDPDLRTSLRQALQNAQHQVTDAEDFVDALIHLASNAFDAVITDEQLGSTGSGRILLMEVRRRWPCVRRILCTSSSVLLAEATDPDVVQRRLPLPVEEQLLRASLL